MEDWKSVLAVLDRPLGIKSASYRNFCLALASEEWQEVAKLSWAGKKLGRLPDLWNAYL